MSVAELREQKMPFVVVFYVCLSFFIPFTSADSEKFEVEFYLEGYSCAVEHVIFVNKATDSKFDCFIRCKIHSNCSGVFYQEDIRTCIGCTNRNMDKFLPATSQTVYFRRSERSIYKLVDIKQTWSKSVAHCTSLGGSLVQIDSQDEQEHLVNIVLTDVSEDVRVWIGGSKRDADGKFVWLQGSLISSAYENWLPGAPSAHEGEDCLVLNPRRFWNFEWNDFYCDELCLSVCEFM